MAGASQWVIQHDGHLESAISYEKDAGRCREVFKTLAIASNTRSPATALPAATAPVCPASNFNS